MCLAEEHFPASLAGGHMRLLWRMAYGILTEAVM